jgi:hypothetical protein
VRHVLELVVPPLGPGGAAEVVDRDGGVAALGEAQRKLLVEAIEPADVGQDRESGPARLDRCCPERREPVAVARLEHEFVPVDRGAGDRWDGRHRVAVEAHARKPNAASGLLHRRLPG